MKNQKHTPGPWYVTYSEKFGSYYVERSKGQDAALIAAAPEMLEALSRVFNECRLEGCTPELNDLIISAIKKAKGE